MGEENYSYSPLHDINFGAYRTENLLGTDGEKEVYRLTLAKLEFGRLIVWWEVDMNSLGNQDFLVTFRLYENSIAPGNLLADADQAATLRNHVTMMAARDFLPGDQYPISADLIATAESSQSNRNADLESRMYSIFAPNRTYQLSNGGATVTGPGPGQQGRRPDQGGGRRRRIKPPERGK